MIGSFQAVDVLGNPISTWDAFIGLIPGSIGETSVLAILIGAVILLVTGIASWKTMVSVFVGGAFMSLIHLIWSYNGRYVRISAGSLVLRWFRFWCRVHGYRSCDFRSYGDR